MTTNDTKAVTRDSMLYNPSGTIYTEIYEYDTPRNHVTQRNRSPRISIEQAGTYVQGILSSLFNMTQICLV